MLDYRQVDMSSITFGDPNYGTPVLGTEIHPIPYESVIKSYCDAGEQPYKRFGPCVNLKGSRVNGKIYMKHFHDSDNYKVKELKTWDSKNSDEYYKVESGAPDGSVNEAQCEQYATSLGLSWGIWDTTNNYGVNYAKGCLQPSVGNIRYNKDTTNHLCGTDTVSYTHLRAHET